MVKFIFATALAVLNVTAVQAQQPNDLTMIVHWESQHQICDKGEEDAPETWIACGRSDALAAVLAERGYCLDRGLNVWRVGTRSRVALDADQNWMCVLFSS